MNQTVQANSFYDLASVEVLRGPQGTLVGSNSTGGAIFINRQNPLLDEGVGGYAMFGGGNYGSFTRKLFVKAGGRARLGVASAENVAPTAVSFTRPDRLTA